MPNNDVRSIKENDEGKIFIGTRYGGLAIFNKTKLIQIATDNQDKKDIEIINRDSGLVSNDIWSLTKTPGRKFLDWNTIRCAAIIKQWNPRI